MKDHKGAQSDFKLHRKMAQPKYRGQSVMWGSREGAGGVESLARTQTKSQKAVGGRVEEQETRGVWGLLASPTSVPHDE